MGTGGACREGGELVALVGRVQRGELVVLVEQGGALTSLLCGLHFVLVLLVSFV